MDKPVYTCLQKTEGVRRQTMSELILSTYLDPRRRSTWARSMIRSQPVRWPGFSPCNSQDASLSVCSRDSLCTCSSTRSSAAPAEEQRGRSGLESLKLNLDSFCFISVREKQVCYSFGLFCTTNKITSINKMF